MAEGELKRSIGFWTILSMAVMSIIGTGIFFGAAVGAKYSGVMSLVAWGILTIFAVYIAACFGELVSMFPSAGGIYEYGKQTYSKFISFQIGWLGWIVTVASFALLSIAAVDYLTPLEFPTFYKILIAVVFIIVLNTVTYIGMEASSVMINAFALITVMVLLVILIPSFFKINTGNFVPFVTHPFSAVFLTLFFIIETFFGWEEATNLAEETRNPEKTIPKALIFGTLIVAAIGFMMAFIGLGMLGWQKLAETNAPLAVFAGMTYGEVGKIIISMGIYLAMIGSAAAGIISAPRLLMAMARDKLFLPQFTKVHPTYNTPSNAIILQTIVGIIIIVLGFGKYEPLLALLVPLALVIYVAMMLAIPLLRFRRPELSRPFKVPLGTIGPFVVIGFFLAVIVAWLRYYPGAASTFVLAMSLTFVSFPVYFLVEMYYNPSAIIKVNDLLAHLTLLTERLFFPKKLRSQVLKLMGDVKGKKVLEYGCSVGTLTVDLADAVGPSGRVYAVNHSLRESKITFKRLRKRGHKNFRVVHHPNQSRYLHPSIPKVDLVVSVGMLGYVQNMKKVLQDMNNRLQIKDKILFLEYDKYFGVIPNVDWVADDSKIEKIFKEEGFNVAIIRKKGLFWENVFIYGVKYKNV
ncbi:MAG: amino acid permease [Nanoarchaeota archaeon]|nr:amino acid permease [Nanoarchaeota archaeon]